MNGDGRALPPGTPGPGAIAAFAGARGATLAYRAVRAAPERHRLVYCHGIESHGGWFLPAAFELARRGVTTFLPDRRGSGLNRGARPGDARSAAVLLEDLRAFRREVAPGPVVLLGLSWGGKLAAAAALDAPDGVRGLVLVTPGLKARVDLAPRDKIRCLASLAAGGRALLHVPIEPEMFTEAPALVDWIRSDPLRLDRVTARLLWAGRRLDRRIARGLGRLEIPVLVFLAGRDRIIDNDGVLCLLGRMDRSRLTVKRYPDATHSIQLEQTPEMVRDIAAFLETLPS